jgi:F-type H+-transporting ATPase subunit gamma
MDQVLANLNSRVASKESASPLLVGTGRDQVHLLVIATGERGLCGAFNTNIVKLARERIVNLLGQGKEVKILCVGRKGADQLRREYGKHFVHSVDLRAVRQLGFANANDIGRWVLKSFDDGEFDVATLFFSQFKNILTQQPTALQLIPAKLPEGKGEEAGEAEVHADYEFEPEEDEILRDLLPRNISTQIFRALLENHAGFYGSQMTAMDNATRNAGEMIDKLTLKYNRMRQANITRELIEIISGAEAV